MKPNPFRDSIVEIVKEPVWQRLRASLVGTWKANTKANVLKLRRYLGKMDDPRRVRIVLNYLVGSAFRLGIIQSPEIDRLREQVRKRWKKMKEAEHE